MPDTPPQVPGVLAHLEWQVGIDRVQAIRSGDFFACNARLRDPDVYFSIVLRWPSADLSEARLALLVDSPEMQPTAQRLVPGLALDIMEGPRLLARAIVVGMT